MIATMKTEIADLECEIALRRRRMMRRYRGWSIIQLLEAIAVLKRRIQIKQDAEHRRFLIQQEEEASIGLPGF